MNVYESLMFD